MKYFTLVFITLFLLPLTALSKKPQTITLNNYLKYFYNRHSHFLDTVYDEKTKSWSFDIPYYEPTARWQKSMVHPRWHLSEATYYKYLLTENPSAHQKVKQAILDATNNQKRPIQNQSFQDAIAYFLIIRIFETKDSPRLLALKEYQSVLQKIKSALPFGLKAADTENRAALAGVFWYYVGNYLYQKNILTAAEFEQVKIRTKEKIDLSLKQSVNQSDFKYREGRNKLFTLHYHLVESYMLLAYGKMTGKQEYIKIAQIMTGVVNKLARQQDGFLNPKFGFRPDGLGAQTYLMAGMLNSYFGNQEQADKFFNYAYGNRFFKDPKHPNRLVWVSDSTKSSLLFNDDISFVNMAELALILLEGQKLKITL